MIYPQLPEDFIHRIGRTARAGAEGSALSFVGGEDRSKWNAIQRLIDPNFKQDKNSGDRREEEEEENLLIDVAVEAQRFQKIDQLQDLNEMIAEAHMVKKEMIEKDLLATEEVIVDQPQDLNEMIAEVIVDQPQDLNEMIAEVIVDQPQDLNEMIAEADSRPA